MIDKLPTVGPKIVQISAIALPAQIAPGFAVITIGLSDDSKVYQWDGNGKKWVAV